MTSYLCWAWGHFICEIRASVRKFKGSEYSGTPVSNPTEYSKVIIIPTLQICFVPEFPGFHSSGFVAIGNSKCARHTKNTQSRNLGNIRVSTVEWQVSSLGNIHIINLE